MGSRIAAVALSFLIYERTGSAIWLAGTLFFTFGVTGFLTPLAGKIADRNDRRRVMITSDVLSLATWLLLVFRPSTPSPSVDRVRRLRRHPAVWVRGERGHPEHRRGG